jgi:hypothetical protein
MTSDRLKQLSFLPSTVLSSDLPETLISQLCRKLNKQTVVSKAETSLVDGFNLTSFTFVALVAIPFCMAISGTGTKDAKSQQR